MKRTWMSFAQASEVLGCDEAVLQRFADAGDLMARHREGHDEVCLDVATAGMNDEVIPAVSGENEIALALARLAQSDARRARRQLRLACVAIVGLMCAAAGGFVWSNNQATQWREAYLVAQKHEEQTSQKLEVVIAEKAKLDQELRDKKELQQEAVALLERVRSFLDD